MTFEAYFQVWRANRRGSNYIGLDDGSVLPGSARSGPERIDRPTTKLKGQIRTLVLLVDFPDLTHDPDRSAGSFDQMLFSEKVFPTGSMRDFYQKASGWNNADHGIDVVGAVHGWFRLPEPINFYADSSSGMDGTFPRNAQGMARDAVLAAKAAGIDVSGYDAFGEGEITALFVIHAGRGAEVSGSRNDIWSHKWIIPQGIDFGGIKASKYLTVPEDCHVGVCAHEWGHLAARWADYYDTGKSESTRSNGLGDFCLMASGSWGQNGLTPTFPNGMLRMFHGWTKPDVINKSKKNLVLKPAAEGGSSVVITNHETMSDGQYILVEYRRKKGQDKFLPDQGIAIYVVDEGIDDVNREDRLAIELLQADGLRELALTFGNGNRGDADDLYNNNGQIGQRTKPPLNMPNGKWSGISIKVNGNAGDEAMSIDVSIATAGV
ncbi:M6 family metalloprotease domain-containing protein [Methylobacterium haplocladii]|nr:M6 family metalloprotease domain-containing protein [Methylobacterium haplocladii]